MNMTEKMFNELVKSAKSGRKITNDELWVAACCNISKRPPNYIITIVKNDGKIERLKFNDADNAEMIYRCLCNVAKDKAENIKEIIYQEACIDKMKIKPNK